MIDVSPSCYPLAKPGAQDVLVSDILAIVGEPDVDVDFNTDVEFHDFAANIILH